MKRLEAFVSEQRIAQPSAPHRKHHMRLGRAGTRESAAPATVPLSVSFRLSVNY